MDGEKAAVFVHFPAHKLKNILFFIPGQEGLQAAFNFRAFRFIVRLKGQLVVGLEIIDLRSEAFPGLVAVLEGLEFGHGFFRRGGIAPEILPAGFRLDVGYTLLKGSVFKDASRYRRFGFSVPV
jgi:hypothetical protein